MNYKIQFKNITIIIIIILFGLIFHYLYVIDSFSIFYKTSFSIKTNKQIVNIHIDNKGVHDNLLTADIFENGKMTFTNSWPLKYEIFKVDTGDINNDKSTDIFVGVVKSTRFDSISRKRIFIFKLFEGYIRPLWLGSRVSQPLIDFKFYQSKLEGVVRTIEIEKDQTYLVAEYHWIGFGLGFIHYIAREKTLYQAYKILNSNYYEH